MKLNYIVRSNKGWFKSSSLLGSKAELEGVFIKSAAQGRRQMSAIIYQY